MIPFQIMMVPVYKIYKTLRLQNSLFGMILILTGTSVAYATFMYVGFVKSIPKELEEAAETDGCGPYKTFFPNRIAVAEAGYCYSCCSSCVVVME